MTTATDMLAKYLAAEAAVLEGKEVSLGDRKLRMEDLASITAGRKEWERRVQQEAGQATAVVEHTAAQPYPQSAQGLGQLIMDVGHVDPALPDSTALITGAIAYGRRPRPACSCGTLTT